MASKTIPEDLLNYTDWHFYH